MFADRRKSDSRGCPREKSTFRRRSLLAEPTTRLSDSNDLTYKLSFDKPSAGNEFTVAVRVTDEFENQSVEKAVTK